MDVKFENKYIVSEESGSKYHSSAGETAKLAPKANRRGTIIRVVGLAVSVFIIVIAILLQENLFLLIGLALAGIYIYRIFYFFRKSPAPQVEVEMKPIELKWQRVIRFGDCIVVEDPRYGTSHDYEQLIRMTEDPAYCTLWFSDSSTLRVSKNGFTVGTLDEFHIFIENIVEQNLLNKMDGKQ